MKTLQTQDWYKLLLNDVGSAITEYEFNSRWSLIVGYHKVGQRLRQEAHRLPMTELLHKCAVDLDVSERKLWYAIQFFDKYPNIQKLPDGKNISWSKIKTKYLPKPKDVSEPLISAEGKYQVIVIDPPWPYGTEFNSQTRRVASPYPELSIEKLAEFNLPADDNCVLWLWTTHKFLFDSFHLMKLWEFEYKLTFVWDKQKIGMGAWLRCQTEFCLLGIKGKPEWNLTNQRDFLSTPRREHSRKPDEFYKLAESLWPEAKRIDIFSREKRPGWEQYGNEPTKME